MWIMPRVKISKDARKLTSFDISNRDNIRPYECNNLHVYCPSRYMDMYINFSKYLL